MFGVACLVAQYIALFIFHRKVSRALFLWLPNAIFNHAITLYQVMTNPTITVKLSQPIERTTGAITEITLRKPATGELRGLKLMDVMQMDVNALGVLLPRIAQPTITKADIDAMSLADITELGVEVIGFFSQPVTPAPAPAG